MFTLLCVRHLEHETLDERKCAFDCTFLRCETNVIGDMKHAL